MDEYSVERSQFAAEWDEIARQHGSEPGDTGHGGGPLRQGWSDLEQQVRPKDDMAIVEQAAVGDEGGLAYFEHALDAGLPKNARAVAERQMAAIRSAVETLRIACCSRGRSLQNDYLHILTGAS